MKEGMEGRGVAKRSVSGICMRKCVEEDRKKQTNWTSSRLCKYNNIVREIRSTTDDILGCILHFAVDNLKERKNFMLSVLLFLML